MIIPEDAVKAISILWARLPPFGTEHSVMTADQMEAISDLVGVIRGDRETAFRILGIGVRPQFQPESLREQLRK